MERPSGKADLEILLKPMMIDKTVEPGHTPHMIVFINEPERSFQIETRILMSLYGLTSEVALSKLLAEGANLDQGRRTRYCRNTAGAQLDRSLPRRCVAPVDAGESATEERGDLLLTRRLTQLLAKPQP